MKRVVLVVRKRDRFSSLLNEKGFETVNLPLIETAPVLDLTEFDRKIAALESYDGVFLTSPAAATVFLGRLGGKVFSGNIYVLGKRIRRLFERRGIETVYFEAANTIEEFLNCLPPEEFAGKRFLFPRGNLSLRTIPVELNAAAIDEAVVYRTIKPQTDKRLLEEIKEMFSREELKAACFFSPSGINNFLETFADFRQKNIKIAAIGTTTARAGESRNLKIDFISSRSSIEAFALELAEYLKDID